MTAVYRPQLTYRLLALVSLVMAALFAWDLVHGFDAGSALFFAVTIGLLLWSLRTSMTSVRLNSQNLVVSAPLTRPTLIEFGQILSISEEGRLGKTIVITYHPRQPDGMLDLDRAQSVNLPALNDQEALYAELANKAPL